MWMSQRFQYISSALLPLYSLSSLLAAPAVTASQIHCVEASSVQRAYSFSIPFLSALATQHASLLGLGWIGFVLIFIIV